MAEWSMVQLVIMLELRPAFSACYVLPPVAARYRECGGVNSAISDVSQTPEGQRQFTNLPCASPIGYIITEEKEEICLRDRKNCDQMALRATALVRDMAFVLERALLIMFGQGVRLAQGL